MLSWGRQDQRARFASSNILRSCQRVEQRLGVLKVGRFEALGEPAVDGREQVVRLLPLAVLGPQAGEDRRGAELLFQVLTERGEKNSMAIASNDSFSKEHLLARTCA